MRMLAVTGSKPDMYVRLIVLVFCALGTKSQRAKKGGLCAAALAEVASLRVCRGSLIYHFLSMRVWRCWSLAAGASLGVRRGSLVSVFFLPIRVLRFLSDIYACWRLRVQNPVCTCD